MEKKDRKNNFDLNQWVPPNPLVHEIKIKKELLTLGDKAKYFCISRWLDLQVQENVVIHIKNMRKMHSNAGAKWLKEDELTYPNTMIAKIYFPITDELNLKKIKMGFRNKEGKTYPRLGVSLPERVYVDFTFPSIKGQKHILPEHKRKILNILQDTNLLNYLPHRDWDADTDLIGVGLGGIALPETDGFEDGKTYALLTEKNWTILTKEVDIEGLNEYLKGVAPEWGSIDRKGYYTAEYIASSKRAQDNQVNEPDIQLKLKDFIEGDH